MINPSENKTGLISTLKLVGTCLVLTSCSAFSPPHNDAETESTISQMSDCEKLDAVLAAYANDFERIRIKKNDSPFGDIWEVRYNLIGHNCQVYRWGNHYSYGCNISAPSKETSLARLEIATQRIEACLDQNWTKSEKPVPEKEGETVIYSSTNSNAVISTHAYKADGPFRKEWLNYIFIGDKKQITH